MRIAVLFGGTSEERDEVFPADLPIETTRLVQRLGLQAHQAVKAGPYSSSTSGWMPMGSRGVWK